ncbi:hypothetical protein IKG13_00110 [Candidatus Saccharibacteria bacterium]|nr:hypothetical protein [Candidatus Saccharibacteria bacterium]
MKIILHIAETIADKWRPLMQKYDKCICIVTKSDDLWHIDSKCLCGSISQKSDLATDIANYISLSEGYGSVPYDELPIFKIEIVEENDSNA